LGCDVFTARPAAGTGTGCTPRCTRGALDGAAAGPAAADPEADTAVIPAHSEATAAQTRRRI
jgi:hypothetical protein